MRSTTAGDEDFDARYEALFVRAERAAGRVLHDASLSEDVAAETMARALVKWSRISGYAEAWVTRAAVNRAIDQSRRKDPPIAAPAWVGIDDGVVTRLTLHDTLRRLPRRQREVVVMRYLLDLGEAETARTLGMSPDTVRTHARRALQKLRVAVPGGDEVIDDADQPA